MQPIRATLAILTVLLGPVIIGFTVHAANQLPSFATGIKVGEVSSDSALVWARLCAVGTADPTSPTAAAPGAPGSVRIRYWPRGQQDQAVSLEPVAVDAERDYTCQVSLGGLSPQTIYDAELTAYASDGAAGETVRVHFKTAPKKDQVAEVTAVIVTCQGHNTVDDPVKGHAVYSHMLTHDPDFFIHTGDVVYYDKGNAQPLSQTVAAARQRWNRMFSYTWNRAFPMQVSSYFMKDDHDTLKNDCWPGQSYGEISWDEGLALFREQVPMGEKPYRTFRWGKDLQVWLVEGRDYRSPNPMPDGPRKTIWGAAQKQWFFDTVTESDATFRILVSPTPIVGPDRATKNDNHANQGFSHEGDELRRFIGQQKNMFVICGDRHWQYISEDPPTGVREYACGPASDAQAGGFREDQRSPRHRYLKVKGGFLSVAIERKDGLPRAVLTHHGVDGSIYNRDILQAE